MNTLLLDLTNWDLCVDAFGNIAMATPPYAVAQDVASACKTFKGEVYYDTTLGVQYRNILGQNPPASLLDEYMVQAALTVPDVATNPSPVSNITGFTNRGVTGIISFTDIFGNAQTVTFT